MHITQTNVIAKLMYNDELRYSEIKPDDMSGNQFSYHLDRLIADKLVEKNQNGLYSLTLKGMRLTDSLSQKTMKRAIQPKSAVMLFAQNAEGQILLQRRGRRPFSGVWNLPGTRIQMKEHPSDALLRVTERRAIIADAPTHLEKIISIKMGRDADDFVSDLLLHMFVYDDGLADDYVVPDDRYRLETISAAKHLTLFPGVRETIDIMQDGTDELLYEVSVPLEYDER